MAMPLKRRDAIRLAEAWARDGVPAELLRAQPALARPERNPLTALASPPAALVYARLRFCHHYHSIKIILLGQALVPVHLLGFRFLCVSNHFLANTNLLLAIVLWRI